MEIFHCAHLNSCYSHNYFKHIWWLTFGIQHSAFFSHSANRSLSEHFRMSGSVGAIQTIAISTFQQHEWIFICRQTFIDHTPICLWFWLLFPCVSIWSWLKTVKTVEKCAKIIPSKNRRETMAENDVNAPCRACSEIINWVMVAVEIYALRPSCYLYKRQIHINVTAN